MREALSSLPWVKKVDVQFAEKKAILTVEPGKLDEQKMNEVLKAKNPEFGAKIVK